MKKAADHYHFDTLAIHAGFHSDPVNGAVMPPIYLSSTFAQTSPGVHFSQYEYSRTNNPTRDILQTNLAILEQGHSALCFSSGCAALAAVLQALPPNSHVILGDDVYGGTLRLFDKVFGPLGLTYTQCDLSDTSQLKDVFTSQTQLIWLETPSNPLLKISDIAAISEIKQQVAPKVIFAVDNTFATPYLQNPLSLGADLVLHSTTKYLGGHSDIIGGALITKTKELGETLAFYQNAIGAIPSPMDCYLLLRSIKTLSVRMKAHCHNAKILAEFLSTHPKVKKVIYPGLQSHPQHNIARKQMRDFGGMISIILHGSMMDSTQFLQKLKIFTLAESLGGVESLIEHPSQMTHAAIPAAHRYKIGIEDTLVRLSVGIEDPDDLKADLNEALHYA